MKNNNPRGARHRRMPVHGFLAAAVAVLAGASLGVPDALADEEKAVQAAANTPAGLEGFSCRYEKPTGSRRSIKVCRALSAIEDDSDISKKSMGRAQHYGNPSLSPPD